MRPFPILHLLLFLLASCNTADNCEPYCDCCETAPFSDTIALPSLDTFNEARIYIPNIFVTGGTQYGNDHFVVFANNGVSHVTQMHCLDENQEVLFENTLFSPNVADFGWDGMRSSGEVFRGRFHWEVTVRLKDRQEKAYAGEACSFSCGDDGFPEENRPGCGFPTQNVDGSFDPLFGTDERECFE